MARDFSKMSDEEMEAIYQANFGSGQAGQAGQVGQASQVGQVQTRPQGTFITDLLDKISPKLTNSVVGGLQGFASGTQQSALDIQHKQAQINALNNKQNQGYFTLDAEGNAVPVIGAPAGSKHRVQGRHQTACRNDDFHFAATAKMHIGFPIGNNKERFSI